MYGPGRSLRTNAQRLRADRDYTPGVPPGRVRIVCSGDSFTRGHSVGDADAWCRRLEDLDPRVETVNMGQAAYGADQAFLWYRRDAERLSHDVHVFAVITSDFERMRRDSFGGYPKPYLRLDDGDLVVRNTPVPRRMALLPLLHRLEGAGRELRAVELGRRALRRAGLAPDETSRVLLDEDEAREVAVAVLEELARLNRERGSRLVLAYLPRPYERTVGADPWRALVAREAARHGALLVDLVDPFLALPEEAGDALFVAPGVPSHYNERGNEWVAAELWATLRGDPAIGARLAAAAPGDVLP
jgi:hypothetical protein